ncbi:BnaAnng33910D [Brassica napus]|uniref:BnaAnng33910D protein n=1 Tax=Brassica napus TaxID=3708 RepID=A0A078JXW6_BRANA|nr:BnaAnng33910D [Brassica napus]
MDRQAENVPSQTSFVLSTQFPCPPSGQNRGSMPPPRRSSLPPLPPKRPTTTTTTRHQQIGLQNFNPGPRLLPPQSPVFRSWTPMSSPAPSSSFQYLQSAPPVAYHNAALPPRPPTTSVSARGSAYSGNDSAVFPSMDAMKMIYPEPIEMPVGVNYSKEGHGEPAGFMDEQVYMDLDEIFDFSTKDDDVARIGSGSSENNKRNAGVKKRAAPSRKTRRKSVSPSVDCNNLNNWKSSVAIEKGMFTESQMNEIARSKTLQKYVVTDPKYAKRMLSNREGARRSVKRTAQHILNLEEKVQTLEKEGVTLTVHTSFAEKKKLGLEEENKQLRIRLQEIQDQSKRANEINWVKQKGTEEVFPDWDTTMDEFLLEQLNELNEEPETNNCGFE